MSNNKFWRLEGMPFRPVDQYSTFSIAGESFFLPDGLFGLAVSPKLSDKSRYLAFRPLASRSLYLAKIKDILLTQYYFPLKYFSAEDVLPSQVSTLVFSSDGTLFFHLTAQTATGCWNSKKLLIPENIVICLAVTTEECFTNKYIKNKFYRESQFKIWKSYSSQVD